MVVEPGNEGVNEERPPTPPVLQSPGNAARDSPPHASDGKLSHLDIFFVLITDCLRIYIFFSFLLMLLYHSLFQLILRLIRRGDR